MSEASPKKINVPPQPGDATVEEVTDHAQKILAEETHENRIVWDSSSHIGRAEESQKDWRERLKGLVGEIQELGGKGVEWTKEGVKKASNYLGNEWEQGSAKLKNLLGKESIKSKAEQVSAMSKYLAERYKDRENVAGKLFEDAKKLGNWYRKLPLKTKMIVAGGFVVASGVLTVTGGSASWLYVPFMSAFAGKRVLGGLSAYTGIEAMLEKQLAAHEARTGRGRDWKGVALKHGMAGAFGILVGEGVIGAGIKEVAEQLGNGLGLDGVVERLAHLWPHGAATEASGSSAISHPASPVELPKSPPAFGFHGEPLSETSINASPVAAGELAGASVEMGPVLDHPIGVSIDARGEGAGQLFADLKEQLREAGYSATNGPEEVRHLMSTRVQELAREYGLNTMQMGDHLEVNARGELVFTHAGVPRTLLGHPLGADSHLRASVRGHHPSASSVETAEEAETRALNIGQLHHPGVVNGSDIHPHDIPAPQPSAPAGAPQASAGYTRLGDFLHEKPPADFRGAFPAGAPPAPGDHGMTTLGQFEADHGSDIALNAHGVPLDAAVSHVYESPKGEYVFGGSGDLSQRAQEYASAHGASVFVNKSYTDLLGTRIVRVEEFAPNPDGPAHDPVLHTDPAYDLDPKTDFTGLIK